MGDSFMSLRRSEEGGYPYNGDGCVDDGDLIAMF